MFWSLYLFFFWLYRNWYVPTDRFTNREFTSVFQKLCVVVRQFWETYFRLFCKYHVKICRNDSSRQEALELKQSRIPNRSFSRLRGTDVWAYFFFPPELKKNNETFNRRCKRWRIKIVRPGQTPSRVRFVIEGAERRSHDVRFREAVNAVNAVRAGADDGRHPRGGVPGTVFVFRCIFFETRHRTPPRRVRQAVASRRATRSDVANSDRSRRSRRVCAAAAAGRPFPPRACPFQRPLGRRYVDNGRTAVQQAPASPAVRHRVSVRHAACTRAKAYPKGWWQRSPPPPRPPKTLWTHRVLGRPFSWSPIVFRPVPVSKRFRIVSENAVQYQFPTEKVTFLLRIIITFFIGLTNLRKRII